MTTPVQVLVSFIGLAGLVACRSSAPGAEPIAGLGPGRGPGTAEGRVDGRIESLAASGDLLILDVERSLRIAPAVRAEREAALTAALAAYRAAPDEAGAIWVGRRLAYLGHHGAAVAWYGARLAEEPQSYRLLRHRGHRFLTLRRPDAAERDLAAARALAADLPDEVEPDGQPNALGIPTSTTQGNIDYHLALALYLQGRFDEAAAAWERCTFVWARNDDSRVAAGHWLCTALRRAGREAEVAGVLARLPATPEVIENFAYRDLLDLHAGRRTAEEVLGASAEGVQDATRTYGVARWLMDREDKGEFDVFEGRLLLMELREHGAYESFGRIAAEFDLGAVYDRASAAPSE
jgi:tetratricopeptide (TPR) repeat protein